MGINQPLDRIAVIDHDPVCRSSYSTLFGSWGIQCSAYPAAEDFLEQERLDQLSCLVSGYALPGMNGLELLDQVNAQSDYLPIVFVTGVTTIALAVKLMQGGAFHVLEKPCRQEVLEATVHEALAEKHKHRRLHFRIRNWKAALNSLTWDETRVAQGIAAGTPNAQLAQQLDLGLRTVEKRRRKVFEKLSVDSIPALIEMLFYAAPELLPQTMRQ